MAAAVIDSRDEELAQLKQMVLQLQHQNTILRNQNIGSIGDIDDFSTSSAISVTTLSSKTMVSTSSEVAPASAASIEKLSNPGTSTKVASTTSDQISLELPDEESWLFKPNKGLNSTLPVSTSCMQWVREVFDSPSSQLSIHRFDLLHRLEAILASAPNHPLILGGSAPSLTSIPLIGVARSLDVPSYASNLSGLQRNRTFTNNINTATFTRPRRQNSETTCRTSSLRSSETNILNTAAFSGVPSSLNDKVVKTSGSSDDLHNVADLQVIARMQEDDLKAKVAAMNEAAAAAGRLGSQQSLTGSRRDSTGDPNSAPESPHASNQRLNYLPPSPSQQPPSPTRPPRQLNLRYSLDTQIAPVGFRSRQVGSLEEVVTSGDGIVESSIGLPRHDYGWRGSPSPPLSSVPMRYSPESPNYAFHSAQLAPPLPPHPPLGSNPVYGNACNPEENYHQAAIIVGRSNKLLRNPPAPSTRLPMASKIGLLSTAPPRRPQFATSPDASKLSSNEAIPHTLPSYNWSDQPHQIPQRQFRHSSEQLDYSTPLKSRRTPAPPPRCGSALSANPIDGNPII